MPVSLQEPAAEGIQPFLQHGVRSALFRLIGLRLRMDCRQQIAVIHGGQNFLNKGQCDGKSGVFFQAGKVQADNRNFFIAGLHQCFSQQVNVIGGTAPAACLGNNQSGVVQIIASGAQGVQKLANDQQGRITGVVMYIFQSQFRYMASAVLQQFTVVSLSPHGRRQNAKMDRCHVRNQNGVGLFHLRCKFRIVQKIILHRVPLPSYDPVHPVRQTDSADECGLRPDW